MKHQFPSKQIPRELSQLQRVLASYSFGCITQNRSSSSKLNILAVLKAEFDNLENLSSRNRTVQLTIIHCFMAEIPLRNCIPSSQQTVSNESDFLSVARLAVHACRLQFHKLEPTNGSGLPSEFYIFIIYTIFMLCRSYLSWRREL